MSISLKQIKQLPDTPGVYLFKKGKDILYIGKATSLRDRVRSYLSKDVINTRGVRVAGLPLIANRVDYLVTGSVLEALFLEAELIKRHQPPFNTKEKDDKSFLQVMITKEDWPRVLLVRGKDLKALADNQSAIYGPFPSGRELKKGLGLIRKIFPFRDQCSPFTEGNPRVEKRPCFNAQIGLCPGVCSGAISQKDYHQHLNQLKLFLSGREKRLYRSLERDMAAAVKLENFEQAKIIRDRLFSLRHIQDVALISDSKVRPRSLPDSFRLEAYDVAHLGGQNTVGVMVVVENGEPVKAEYRKFKLRGEAKNISNDVANLREILTRRLTHLEWARPNIVVMDGGIAQVKVAKKVLEEQGVTAAIIGVVKNDRHRPSRLVGDTKILTTNLTREILLANSEAHRFALRYHRQVRGRLV